jgi:competence protein ComEC
MVKFIFWDVQHGLATYFKTPNNKHIVIDLGTGSYRDSNQEFSPLLHLKNEWNVNRLDGVIITHPHRDHIDDIFNLMGLNPVALFCPWHLSEDEVKSGNRQLDFEKIDKYLEITGDCNDLSYEESPFNSANNGGVDIHKFTPRSCSTSNLNNHSIVTVISYAGSKILIPGDNEPKSWNELLERSDFLYAIDNTDILVAPHHGRDSGFPKELFDDKLITPKLTIISDGRFCDTSATDRYDKVTEGWTVHKRSSGEEKRKCVTTRSNGVIEVEFGENADNKNYIEVNID